MVQVTKKNFEKLINDLGGNVFVIAEELEMSQQSFYNILSNNHPAKLKKTHIYMLMGLKQSLKGRKLI